MALQIYPLPESNTTISSIRRLRESIIGRCKDCNGTGFSGSRSNHWKLITKLPCPTCTKKFFLLGSLVSCGVPSSFASTCFEFHEHLHKDDLNFLNFILDMFKKDPEKPFNVCISSDYKGVGKSGSVVVLMKKMFEHIIDVYPILDAYPFTYCSVSHLAKKFFSSIDKKDEETISFMDSIYMNQVLILDGLGDHYAKPGLSGDEQYLTNKMEELIRYRQGNGLTTIATSNYKMFYTRSTGEQMEDPEGKPPSIYTKYGERFTGLWTGGNCKWYDWKTETNIRGLENVINWPE